MTTTGDHAALERKLLALGGNKILVQPEDYLGDLLDRGIPFQPKGQRKVTGAPHKCHQNAALYYATHHVLGSGGHCDLVTGYALAKEGFWYQHSWLWDGKRVIETTSRPVRYFGVILTPSEAGFFVASNVFVKLPGWADIYPSTVTKESPGNDFQI